MISSDEVRIATRLAGVDDQIAVCRAWGHEWASKKLRPGKALPKGFRPRLLRDGCVEVEETCLNNCGKKRYTVTLPGGLFDISVERRYADPRNWPVMHRSENIHKRDFQAETFRRMNEEIMKAATENAGSWPEEEQ